ASREDRGDAPKTDRLTAKSLYCPGPITLRSPVMVADIVRTLRPQPRISEQPDDRAPTARNEGTLLNSGWIESARVHLSATARRAQTMTTRRTVKKEWQAAWLVKAITCTDLTTLAGDDTPQRVLRLCAKARMPLRHDLVEALGFDTMPTVGAVCVYPTMVAT